MSETAGTTTTVQQTTDVSKYMYQIRKLKDQLADAVKDRDGFKAEADEYRKQSAEYKARADNSAVGKQLQDALGRLREIEYRKTWDKVAKAKGIREDALDAAYQLGGYKPDGEEIDEETLGTAIEAQKAKQAFLAGKVETTDKKEAKVAVGSGQGTKSGGSGAFQLPDENDGRWNDPAWQWNNREKIAEAIKERNERGQV